MPHRAGAHGYHQADSRAHTCGVVLGVALTAVGVYEPFAEWAGAGATVPLTGFGYAMAKGTEQAISDGGVRGILTGAFTSASGGVTAAILCGLIASFITRPKEK